MKYKILSSLLLIIFAVLNLQAQQIPMDEKVRYGKLPNGLTYYIRHNNLPEQRVDFYIAQRVGSILEEENQRGLAHFLEHMAFNGTKKFPGISLRDYLQSVGVKFGENLNAYTSVDETVYMIKNVPSTRQGILDTCLLILHDWSGFLLLEDDEIDNERGVIREEWRTRSNASNRMFDIVLPQMYGDDRYGHRLPIGLIDVINNFKYQELRDYYHKWYRPDLQGIIIVGDIDVDQMENDIKKIFEDIPAPVNPAERVYYQVTDNAEPLVAIAADPEATNTSLVLFNKHDAFPKEAKDTYDYLTVSYIKNMISRMINARYQELLQKPDVPFTAASAYDGSFFISKTKSAWTSSATCKEGKINESLTALVHETLRARQHGFTQGEYERARINFLKWIENAYNERDKEKNNAYVQEYVQHFLNNEPTPGIQFEYDFYNTIATNVSLDVINEYMNSIITDDENNLVILLMMPQKEGIKIPTKDELLLTYTRALKSEVTAYADKEVDNVLIKKRPKAGKVKKKTTGPWGITEWILSNGIKIQFKKTDFKQDQVLMKGVSLGGTSLLSEKDMPTINLLNSLITLGGVGEYSRTDLNKALTGKRVSVSPSIGLRTEGITGNCSPSDFETMVQLVYLYMTQPRADKEAFDAYLSRKRTEMQNQESNPRTTFYDSINHAIYGDNVRAKRMKPEMLNEVDYDLALDMYRQRFMNNDSFTFTFVGNIEPDSVQTMIEQYLGALPKTKPRESFGEVSLYARKGLYNTSFQRNMETPKTSVFIYYSGCCPYTLKDDICMSMFSQIMNIVYTRKIREEEGGSYGVSVSGNTSKYQNENFRFQVSFDTDPELYHKLIPIVYNELEEIQNNGPAEADFSKVKEFMLKKIKESKAENYYWLSAIDEYNFTSLDVVTDYENILTGITFDDIKTFASNTLGQQNRVEVIMHPVMSKKVDEILEIEK